eukprot:SM000158S02015  [mRNA]  locus=s158:129318:134894:+ [translate_table: standard]
MAGSQAGWGSSKEFLDLVKSIGEAKSRAEEDRIVAGEIEILKKRIAEPDVPKKKMKEYIIRLVYVEMLGHDASFGYIHAVKMTHDDSLPLKKTGYLAVTLFLDDNHDLIILIVNTIQKDLKSDNHLIVCAALTAVCKLINEEAIPAVLPQVTELLNHPKETIRKKAVMALHRFFQRSPSTVSHIVPRFRQVLCDKDPSVMSAALCALHDLIALDAGPYKNLTASFVSILKQVAEHRLPKLYDYHRTPAPFIQIKLLKILALLGVGDRYTSENMYSVLIDVLRLSDTGSTIGNAILYECICTITSIHPNPKLLETSASVTSKFLKSDSHNLKYMGIDALGRVVRINPEFATEHQIAVIDCLEDPDDTLKRKTLDLLYKMTKGDNVEVIADLMINYMRTVTDTHNKTDIASRIMELAERFAPNNLWYIQIMNSVFELAGDLVRPKVAHDLMRLIAEGSGEEDEDADNLLRSSAVDSYLKLLDEPKLPSVLLQASITFPCCNIWFLIQVICWVLGEYGTLHGSYSAEDIIGRLCDVAESHSSDDVVKGMAITAITKVLAFEIGAGRKHRLLPEARALLDELSASHSTDLQQRAYELQSLLGLPPDIVSQALPPDASCEDIEVDDELHFLDDFVQDALAHGAQPYTPRSQDEGLAALAAAREKLSSRGQQALRFEAYETPTLPTTASLPSSSSATDLRQVASREGFHHRSGSDQRLVDLPAEAGVAQAFGNGNLQNGQALARLKLDGVQKKWGRPMTAPASAPAPLPSSSSQVPPAPASSTSGSSAVASEFVTSRMHEPKYLDRRKQAELEASAEKQKKAAVLFGGGGISGPRQAPEPPRAPLRAKPGALAWGQGARHEGTRNGGDYVPADAQRAQPIVGDLLDFTDMPEPSGVPLSAPVSALDPFQQLEGLLHSQPSQLGSSAIPQGPLIPAQNPLSSDEVAVQPTGLQSVPPATKVVLGPSSASVLQKDAVARQAGVTIGGTKPELFQDLFS